MTRGSRGDERIRRSDEARASLASKSSTDDRHPASVSGAAATRVSAPRFRETDPNAANATDATEEEAEDASVPMDSAFFGVDADEISWDEPLSAEDAAEALGMPTRWRNSRRRRGPGAPCSSLRTSSSAADAAKRMVEEAKAAAVR